MEDIGYKHHDKLAEALQKMTLTPEPTQPSEQAFTKLELLAIQFYRDFEVQRSLAEFQDSELIRGNAQ